MEKQIKADWTVIRGSGLFDSSYYLRANADVAAAGIDPLTHYCEYGWQEGRDPAFFFSTTFYLSSFEDVRKAKVNPFAHFVAFGLAEGRRCRPELVGPKEGIPVISSAKWRTCSGRRPDIADVDVIVPVYRSLNDTAACLYSILSATGDTRFDLVVVNDCSPEPEVTSFLRALSRRRLFHYVEFPKSRIYC